MNSEELSNATADSIQQLGMGYYFDKPTSETAKTLGLNVFEFYGLGRGGTLGDVDQSVVQDAFVFFHPNTIGFLYGAAKEKANPVEIANEHIKAAYAYADRTFGAVPADVLSRFAAATRKVVDAVEPGHHLLVDGYKKFDVPSSSVHAAYLGAILMRELRGCVHIDAVNEVGLTPAEACYLQDQGLFSMHGYGEADIPEVTPEKQADKARAEELTSQKIQAYFSVLSDEERDDLANGAALMFAATKDPVAVA